MTDGEEFVKFGEAANEIPLELTKSQRAGIWLDEKVFGDCKKCRIGRLSLLAGMILGFALNTTALILVYKLCHA